MSILLVFSIHLAGTQRTVPPSDPWLAAAWTHLARNGAYGVSLFFVVSGYVITRSIVARNPDLSALDLRGFYARRAGRILPPLLLSIALGALMVATTVPRPGRVAFLFHNTRTRFDLPFWLALGTFSFNWLRIAREQATQTFGLHWDILWSLAVEEQFYLLYPLVLRVARTRRTILLVLVLVVASGPVARLASNAVDPSSFLVVFTNSFVCFDLIATGALLFFVLERIGKRIGNKRSRPVEIALGGAAALILVSVYWFTYLGDPDERVWAPSVVGLSLAVFMGSGIRGRWFDSRLGRALVDPGQVSYGAYLFHPLVLFLSWSLLAGKSAFAGLSLLAVSTLVLAYLLYAFFERPLNRRVRSFLLREPR